MMSDIELPEALTQGIVAAGVGIAVAIPLAIWARYYVRGRRVALRDRLRPADAIVSTAGTSGNIEYLNSKIRTSVALYRQGWAPRIIFTGKFSTIVEDTTPQLIPAKELELAAAHGRIQTSDVPQAAATWDAALGAQYMRQEAIKLGVPAEAIITEDESLHTRENAELTACILRDLDAQRIILVSSPFHQLRTFLTFAKALQPDHIEIVNYYPDSSEWNPFTWFLSAEKRRLVDGELARIKKYRAKGDLI